MYSFRDEDRTLRDGSTSDMSERQVRLRRAPLTRVEDYWNTLRGSRLLPLRSEIDPRELKGVLEYCFVLEPTARLRVAGSHLSDLMGREVRGMQLSSFLVGNARQEFGDMLEEVFETPATASVLLSAENGIGHPPLLARMILLPLRSDLGDINRVMGALVAEGDIGRAPHQFDIETITLNLLLSRDVPKRSTSARLATDAFRSHCHGQLD